jgi:hypothetical protein
MRSSAKIMLASVSAGVLLAGAASAREGACARQISEVTKQLAASDAGSGPTKGSPAPTAGEQKGQHPATELMNKETQGKAASPEDVLRQGGIKAEAGKALERARKLDAKGQEAACMAEVKSARQLAAQGR